MSWQWLFSAASVASRAATAPVCARAARASSSFARSCLDGQPRFGGSNELEKLKVYRHQNVKPPGGVGNTRRARRRARDVMANNVWTTRETEASIIYQYNISLVLLAVAHYPLSPAPRQLSSISLSYHQVEPEATGARSPPRSGHMRRRVCGLVSPVFILPLTACKTRMTSSCGVSQASGCAVQQYRGNSNTHHCRRKFSRPPIQVICPATLPTSFNSPSAVEQAC